MYLSQGVILSYVMNKHSQSADRSNWNVATVRPLRVTIFLPPPKKKVTYKNDKSSTRGFTPRHDIEAYGGMEVKLQSFLTKAINLI